MSIWINIMNPTFVFITHIFKFLFLDYKMNNLANYVYDLAISNYHVDDIEIIQYRNRFTVKWTGKNLSYEVNVSRRIGGGYNYYRVAFRTPIMELIRPSEPEHITQDLTNILLKYSPIKPHVQY